jgi:4-hydroxybenzoate polyprenyltransferase
VSLVSGVPAVFVFCAAMAAGMWLIDLRDRDA